MNSKYKAVLMSFPLFLMTYFGGVAKAAVNSAAPSSAQIIASQLSAEDLQAARAAASVQSVSGPLASAQARDYLLPSIEGFERVSVSAEGHGVPTAAVLYQGKSEAMLLRVDDCDSPAVCSVLQQSKAGAAASTDDIFTKSVSDKGVVTLSTVRNRFLVSVSGLAVSDNDLKAVANETLKHMLD